LRDVFTGLLGLAGIVLLATEAPTIPGQLTAMALGLGLLVLAWACWRLWDKLILGLRIAAMAAGLALVAGGLTIWAAANEKERRKVHGNLSH